MTRTAVKGQGGRSSLRLAGKLRKAIASGRMAGGDYLPTVRDLCSTHELSIDPVCRALRGLETEGLIVAEPRQGYRVLARANEPERGCPLAVIMPAERRQWDELVVGLVEELRVSAAARGRSLLAIGTGGLSPAAVLEQLRAAKAWGALVSVDDRQILDALAAAGLPVVLVETWAQNSGFDTVVQDGFRGAMAAAEWLVGRGRERIAWFGRSPRGKHPQIAERFAGAVAGLARAGLEISPELRFDNDAPGHEELIEPARRMLSGPDRPKAILALWQPQCQALAMAARMLGLVPGKDFDMVGWSTTETLSRTYAPLFAGGEVPPAVAWSVREMAETALARLEERRAKPAAPPITLQIPARLVVSGKTEPAAQKEN
jgi:DNA-binding LacI/PurR family transcriptional regulator